MHIKARPTGQGRTLSRERSASACHVDPRALRVSAQAISEIELTADRYPFRANDYYLDLIDWEDPRDPIARLIVPSIDEIGAEGSLDPSDEASNTKLVGLQHKYANTALLLVTDQCAGFCRYCFRKRLFQSHGRETSLDVGPGIDYIRAHPEIRDVLITGGDPLTLLAAKLIEILERVRSIPHVRTVRIGSKMPAFNPSRILLDHDLLEGLRAACADVAVYVMCHFDHPRELTPAAEEAVRTLRGIGVQCLNQCPITAGVNDSADTLAELFERCSEVGCPQYYLFQCRPTWGNSSFAVPIVRSYMLFSEACSRLSGLSRRARFCMSHASGKIEVVSVDREHIYATYHRAKHQADEHKMLVMKRDDTAVWFDQLEPAGV